MNRPASSMCSTTVCVCYSRIQVLPFWGLPGLLVDDRYRARLLKKCIDPVVSGYWENEFAAYDDRFCVQVIGPVRNKIGMILSPPSLRLIFGQPRSTINIGRLMNEGGILVTNLSRMCPSRPSRISPPRREVLQLLPRDRPCNHEPRGTPLEREVDFRS